MPGYIRKQLQNTNIPILYNHNLTLFYPPLGNMKKWHRTQHLKIPPATEAKKENHLTVKDWKHPLL